MIKIVKGGVYRSPTNGKYYNLICGANGEAEEKDTIIVYEALFDEHDIFYMTLTEFIEEGKFEYITDEKPWDYHNRVY